MSLFQKILNLIQAILDLFKKDKPKPSVDVDAIEQTVHDQRDEIKQDRVNQTEQEKVQDLIEHFGNEPKK